jgi:RNA polymerase sigma factor (sigma-70 family)
MGILDSHSKINGWAEKFKTGDERAAEKIFNYFYPAIFRYARSRINDKEAAADIAQNVFLKVARMISTFDITRGNFNTWIWQIARNTLTDHLRSVRRNLTDSESRIDVELDEIAGGNESEYLIKDEAEQILHIVKEYTDEDQELFRMRYIAGLSYREIAEMTQRSENALRVALHRIKEKIRQDYL